MHGGCAYTCMEYVELAACGTAKLGTALWALQPSLPHATSTEIPDSVLCDGSQFAIKPVFCERTRCDETQVLRCAACACMHFCMHTKTAVTCSNLSQNTRFLVQNDPWKRKILAAYSFLWFSPSARMCQMPMSALTDGCSCCILVQGRPGL